MKSCAQATATGWVKVGLDTGAFASDAVTSYMWPRLKPKVRQDTSDQEKGLGWND